MSSSLMSLSVMSEPCQSPLWELFSSSNISTVAGLWSPPVDSTTADLGSTRPSGGTWTVLTGFAAASPDANMEGVELLLAIGDERGLTGEIGKLGFLHVRGGLEEVLAGGRR